MIAPRQIPEGDRNFRARVQQRNEASDTIDCLLAEIPRHVEIDAAHMAAATALLARAPEAWERARRILLCPPLSMSGRHQGWVRLPCRQRACPTCAQRRARRLALRATAVAIAFARPVAVLVTCPSRTAFDLSRSLDALHDGLLRLRRRRWFVRACVGGVLAVEAPPTSCGFRWALHAHGILGLAPSANAGEFDARAALEWRDIVGMPGAVFDVERLRGARSLMRYGFKVDGESSACPAPWAMPARMRAHLDSALRGRRLLVAWGAK